MGHYKTRVLIIKTRDIYSLLLMNIFVGENQSENIPVHGKLSHLQGSLTLITKLVELDLI